MSTFLARTAALIIGAFALPLAAHAQDGARQADAPIVVTGEFQRDWERGNRLEAEGLLDLASAERNLVRRSAAVVNAQNARDTASQRANNARMALEQLRQQGVLNDPDEARTWAQAVARAAEEWERQDDRVRTSSSDLERAIERQAAAQEEVTRAQAKIDRGRTMMRNAEAGRR